MAVNSICAVTVYCTASRNAPLIPYAPRTLRIPQSHHQRSAAWGLAALWGRCCCSLRSLSTWIALRLTSSLGLTATPPLTCTEKDAVVQHTVIDHRIDFLRRRAFLDGKSLRITEIGHVPAHLVGQALFADQRRCQRQIADVPQFGIDRVLRPQLVKMLREALDKLLIERLGLARVNPLAGRR